jgi:hypothetical protein
MLTKYVTFDLAADKNSYETLFSMLEELKAKKITESASTCRIEAKVKLDDLCKRLEEMTDQGDHVFVLYGAHKGVEHRLVR